MTTLAKNERMEPGLHDSQKELFESAAASKCLTLTQWAIESPSGAAQRDLEAARSTTLSAKSFDAFATALERPLPEATAELLKRNPVWER